MLNHLGIIMDGNGRWALNRGLDRKAGHKAGLDRAKSIIEECRRLGVSIVSLYVFSTENWKRPTDEVKGLFNLACQYLDSFATSESDTRVIFSGRRAGLPSKLLTKLDDCVAATAKNKGIIVNLCLNYGGRAEIVDACIAATSKGKLTEQSIAKYLYNDLPDVDFIIRTGGQQRLSNFLLYQSAYAELYFTPCLWPDFDNQRLAEALGEYNRRTRNFGGI